MFKWARLRPLKTFRHFSLDSIECRKHILEYNERVNAFVHTSPAPANNLNRAQSSRALENIPIAVKDSICTHDMPTTCSSEMLREFTSPYDATVVKLLKNEGADIVGKTNCDEFGMGSLNTYSIHGPVVNPCSPSSLPSRSAGGSSGGSAAAVAAGMCYAALGTDTGGSTRLPASYCGVVGLKPSYGLLSRHGLVSYADSLDCIGVLASSVDATQRVFDVLNVYDPQDPTSSLPEARQHAQVSSEARLESLQITDTSLKGLRIGIPQEYFPKELNPNITSAFRSTLLGLRSLGAETMPVSMKNTRYALSAYYVLASAEASSCLARYDGVEYGLNIRAPLGTTSTGRIYAQSRSQGFGPEVQKRILLGTYALSAELFDNYFLQARRVRQLVKNDFDRVFNIVDYRNFSASEIVNQKSVDQDGVDLLLHPSAIQTAPLLEDASRISDGVQTYVQDVLTVPASLAGLPGLSVPMPIRKGELGHEDSLPVGVSIVGQWGCEKLAFAVGRAIERLENL